VRRAALVFAGVTVVGVPAVGVTVVDVPAVGVTVVDVPVGAAVSPHGRPQYAKYFKEGYDAYGVDGNASTEEAKRVYLEYGDTLGLTGFMDLSDCVRIVLY
jgi:hypothetical protein